ncbi:uncharacterized protein LOC128729018 [Anopheles nili]|uniref:uncharacterized protein LOC128729018 n=1 Tax=Anopheles nili TaxID=185578 RepID=UPI00237A35D4|nr:uncharacterized protein LOC128729018 [Anopheles nili]
MKSLAPVVVVLVVTLLVGCGPVLSVRDPRTDRASPQGVYPGMQLLSESVHDEQAGDDGRNPVLVLTKDSAPQVASPGGRSETHKALSLESLLVPRETGLVYPRRESTSSAEDEDDVEDEREEIEEEDEAEEERNGEELEELEEQEEDERVEEESERGREHRIEEEHRFPAYYTQPGHSSGVKAPSDEEFPRRTNPCASAIVEHLKSSEHTVPERRSPEAKDTNFYIDISHDFLETRTGIVPGVVYQVEVRRALGTNIRDFYIESLAGDPYSYEQSSQEPRPIGQFKVKNSNGSARNGNGHKQAPGDADSIPRSTWIDDMEVDWLHHAYASRKQAGHEHDQHSILSDTGQRVIFGEPFPAYFDEDDKRDLDDTDNSVELEHEGVRRREPLSAARSLACPRNVWNQDAMFEEQMAINWSVPRTKTLPRDVPTYRTDFGKSNSTNGDVEKQSKTIYFRVLYRTMSSYVIYELIYTMVLLQECSLYLKQSQGSIVSSRLPSGYKDCNLTFPSRSMTVQEQLPGLLLQLTRLNTPCRGGGYLRFWSDQNQQEPIMTGSGGYHGGYHGHEASRARGDHQTISLCGKLEELPSSERSFHFQSHRNTTLQLHNAPLFSLRYRLVDYCYNMTLREQNGTVVLRPGDAALDCYFRIHLPYGYRIALQLLTNEWQLDLPVTAFNANATVSHKSIELGALDVATTNQQFLAPIRCSSTNGMLIELYEDSHHRWTSCINSSSEATRYSLTSSGNNIVLKVSKLRQLITDDSNEPSNPSLTSSSSSPASSSEFHGQRTNGSTLASLLFEYRADPIEPITSRCAFGWIATAQFCISSIERRLPWHEAEAECNRLGGHLLSIRSSEDQQLTDQLLFNSPGYKDDSAYWIGASDLIVEGDFRWNDKFSFTYSNWFPGWVHQENYNRQPNDDGLSGQDCVEIRRHFQIASSSGQTTPSISPLTKSYMWNDRNCDAHNYFLCERMMDEEMPERLWNESECNVTVTLSVERSKATIWSSGFPQQYPDSVDCYTLILAPPGYRVVLDFEEMVLENEPLCSYDYLQLVEPDTTSPYVPSKSAKDFSNTVLFRFRNSRHSGRYSTQHRRKSVQNPSMENSGGATDSFAEGDASGVYHERDISFNVPSIVLQPTDSRYTSSLPLPELSLGNVPRKICGDWSSKLKLLRYVTTGPTLGMRFVSDYSNNYGGYKAKISMENVTSECHDERFKAYNNSCYLIISYPDVDWTTAQQICRGIGAQLASISTTDEQRFITSNIRNSIDYTPRSLYWVGGEITTNGNLEWVDGVKLLFEGWLPGQRPEKSDVLKVPCCLGLQWKVSPTPMISSGLHWTAQKCSMNGGYVCKKPRPRLDETTVKNQTFSGTEGIIQSPGYPNPYPVETDFWIRIVASEHRRIIIQFQKLDLEHQDECLYDYISIQNYPILPNSRMGYSNTFNNEGESVSLTKYHHEFSENSSKFVDEQRLPKGLHFPSGDVVEPNSKKSPSSFPGWQNNSQPTNKFQRRIRYVSSSSGMAYSNTDQAVGADRNTASNHPTSLLNDPTLQFDELTPSFLPYVRWCGTHDNNMARFNFISTGNEAIIRFHSDFSISGAGFSATWSTVDMTGCPLQTITSKEGSIYSPNYPYFLLNNVDCTYVIQAPFGRRVWLEFLLMDLAEDATLQLDIDDGPFEPFADETHLNDGVFVSKGERLVVRLKTGSTPKGKGFHATFKTLAYVNEQRYITLSNKTTGMLYSLNYPQIMPYDVDYTQHLIAPLGEVILLELYGVGFSQHGCHQTGFIEIYDNYTDSNGTLWHLCEHHSNSKTTGPEAESMKTNAVEHRYPAHVAAKLHLQATGSHGLAKPAPIYITSYLNTIHIRQRNANGTGIRLNATVRLQEDAGYKMKLISNADEWVESCKPNPCQYGGKCIIANHKRGICQCYGHFTGRFCGLNICELEPCFFGKCELTATSFKCNCQPGFVGLRCDQRQKPCAENPCESRGECFEKNGGFFCRCHAWWEGPRCEKRMMHIPYKPLSERMLQEPFWLGLITVFVVLAVIGLVWCAKRHFPEKIEKLLADDTQLNRSKPTGVLSTFPPHHLNTALREQLQASAGTVSSSNVTTPASHRTIFGRLGIRKPSILSLSSPQQVGGATARTFSLDDLLRPPPRRTPSPRKKRNNSTPTKKNVNEKKQILQQLVSPAQNAATKQVSLGELIQLSETRLKANYAESEAAMKETTFSENSLSVTSMVRQISDPKLEKKVTFARLLSKVSAEMSSGSEDLANGVKHSSALSLPNEVPPRANSVPPSPCTNEIRSPHSTSSNQGSDSLSSSELALHDFGLRSSNRRTRPKVSSADSILAMFKNFAASSSALNTLPSSIVISPSSTPTASSPQDDVPGDDDSSTSSNHTPVSYSSGGASDSPVFYRQSTIEVPVLDALSAHKSAATATTSSGVSAGAAQLHPPTILLEIPSNGINNKCLSPIREMPTPIPSPALTPIMPRPQRIRTPQSMHDESMSVTFNSGYDDYHKPHQVSIEIRPPDESERGDYSSSTTLSSSQSDTTVDGSAPHSAPMVSIDIHPPTPERKSPERPRDLIIPELVIQQPSPTRERTTVVVFPGSPPPQRASQPFDVTTLPCNGGKQQQQKRFLKQWEKPTSLDLPFAPPMITITCNSSEVVSDADVPSPALSMGPKGSKVNSGGGLGPSGGAVGMCYLSPFSMCIRGDRAPSESNLSSSGYSSMASPGPSRCGSNNPLFSNESDEPGSGPAGPGYSGFHSLMNNRRQSSNVRKKSTDSSTSTGVGNSNASHTASFGHHQSSFRLRSDSETLSDEPLLESNDEGIGTDHLDEKIEEGEIRSAKELELYLGKELIQTGQDIMSQENLSMSQLQLPSIVIQSDTGFDKHSPVSSRSDSPLSERNASMERFSPMFYGKKDQHLPFTDSDGLYDFPSSDGKSAGCAIITTHRKCVGRRKDRRVARSVLAIQSPSKSTSVLLEVPNSKENVSQCSQHNNCGKFTGTSSTRKSPKRRVHRQPLASSSSSTESLTSMREYAIRSSKADLTGATHTISTKDSVEMCDFGDDTGEHDQILTSPVPPNVNVYFTPHSFPYDAHVKEVSSQILPKATVEDVRKPPYKIRRLKAIGNQIRFLRRLERSIHRKDNPAQPSDEDTNSSSSMKDSPKMSSPLIRFKQTQIDEEDESEEDDSKSKYYSNASNKQQQQLQQQQQLLLPNPETNAVTTNTRQHCKISRQRRVPSHDCYVAKPWSEAECKLLGGEVNSD